MPVMLYGFAAAVRTKPKNVRVRYVWLLLTAICCVSVLERFASLYLLTKAGAATWDSVAVYTRNVIGMGVDFAIGAALAFLAIRAPKPLRPKPWYAAAAMLGALFILLQIKTLGGETTRGMSIVGRYGSIDILGGCSAGLLLYGLTRGGFSRLDSAVRSRWVAALSALGVRGLPFSGAPHRPRRGLLSWAAREPRRNVDVGGGIASRRVLRCDTDASVRRAAVPRYAREPPRRHPNSAVIQPSRR